MNPLKGLAGKFLIPYVFTVIFGLWTYVSISNILRYQDAKEDLQMVRIHLLELRKNEKDFMTREFRNPEFLTHGESKYLDNFENHKDSLLQIVQALVRPGLIRKSHLDSVQTIVGRYNDTFHKLTLLIRNKGFKDWGLEGELRRTIHAVENDDARYDRAYMLMLRRHEKDFFLRHDLSYQHKFNSAIDEFIEHIDRRVARPEKRIELIAKVRDYQVNFNRIVEMQQRIGLTEDDGLHGELRAAVHALTPFADHLYTQTSAKADSKLNQNLITLVALFLFITVIMVLILRRHIRKITRNINVIRDSSRQLSKGEFPEPLKVNSVDELGQAHHALNVLTEGLHAKSKFAEAIGKGDLDAQLPVLSDKDILAHSLISMKRNLKTAILETNEVVRQAGEEGDLEARIRLEGKEGAWHALADSVNQLLESVSAPLVTLNWLFHELAAGNLTNRYEREANGHMAHMAQNMNTALHRLNALLLEISNHAGIIDDSSREMLAVSQEMNLNTGEIASAVAQISEGAQRQVTRIDATSTLIEGILQNASEMGERSEAIHQAAYQGAINSQKGTEMVKEVVHVISEIAYASEQTATAMEILTTRSNQIQDVVRLIQEISTQTNLLALNAAIEAAQAGDNGRGFAVVAEEIRKLADGTRQSAQEIGQLIADIKKDTVSTVHITQDMNKRIAGGKVTIEQTAEVFSEMASSSEQTLKLSENILLASQAQKDGIEQIVRHIESIIVIAEQTAAGTEESAASAAQLSAGMRTYTDKAHRLAEIARALSVGISHFSLTQMEGKPKSSKEGDFELALMGG